MTPDWQAINAGPTPSLDEYAALEKADPNAFWRLDSGHHQNLLDAALAEVERLTRVLTDGGVMLAYDALLLTERAEKAEAAIARVRALCDPSVGMATACRPGVRHLDAADVLAAIDGGA